MIIPSVQLEIYNNGRDLHVLAGNAYVSQFESLPLQREKCQKISQEEIYKRMEATGIDKVSDF